MQARVSYALYRTEETKLVRLIPKKICSETLWAYRKGGSPEKEARPKRRFGTPPQTNICLFLFFRPTIDFLETAHINFVSSIRETAYQPFIQSKNNNNSALACKTPSFRLFRISPDQNFKHKNIKTQIISNVSNSKITFPIIIFSTFDIRLIFKTKTRRFSSLKKKMSPFWTEPPFKANLLLGDPPSRGILYVQFQENWYFVEKHILGT